ncbi:unnamed protein product [Heligmosomoides polygyrus]|uniref:Uncharacterized protein n=1 Tax=Heligmosomoides polygyrus TaxID=6339 RepID=A0A183GEH0_HELPZ|nr:unnamed protein product [Heligmosomoides polygyrus]
MLKAVAQIVQRALQDAFSRAGLELPHREPEAHRSLGACPEEKQPEAAHEEIKRQSILDEIQKKRPTRPSMRLCSRIKTRNSRLRLDVIACALRSKTDHILAAIAEKDALIAQLERQAVTLQEKPTAREDHEEKGEASDSASVRHPAPFIKPVRFDAGRRCHPDTRGCEHHRGHAGIFHDMADG